MNCIAQICFKTHTSLRKATSKGSKGTRNIQKQQKVQTLKQTAICNVGWLDKHSTNIDKQLTQMHVGHMSAHTHTHTHTHTHWCCYTKMSWRDVPYTQWVGSHFSMLWRLQSQATDAGLPSSTKLHSLPPTHYLHRHILMFLFGGVISRVEWSLEDKALQKLQ